MLNTPGTVVKSFWDTRKWKAIKTVIWICFAVVLAFAGYVALWYYGMKNWKGQ